MGIQVQKASYLVSRKTRLALTLLQQNLRQLKIFIPRQIIYQLQ
jgi:hypothetical protein